MAHPDDVRVQIRSLDERLARLRTKKTQLLARASHSERKRETRRKILVGAAVLAAVDHEGVPLLRSRAELLRWLDAQLTRPHDRAVFELAAAQRLLAR